MDVIRYIHPQMLRVGEAELRCHLENMLRRREHLCIWDSGSFTEFLANCSQLLGVNWRLVYESTGEQSDFEYFTVLEKT